MKKIQIKKGREAALLRRHPWVFSGAIHRVEGEPQPGETVRLCDHRGQAIALAAWSPQSQIQARVWSFDCTQHIDEDFLRARLQAALERRSHLRAHTQRSAYRLVYGESDHLPGLIVDCYNQVLSCQFLTVGVERWKSTLVALLAELTGCQAIYERSDVASRRKEGLQETSGLLWGELPPGPLIIQEYDYRLQVDVERGHKTGYYLDQADNRHFVGQMSRGLRILNCFSYTGGFGVAALKGGAAEVINVDSSAPALEIAAQNMLENGFSESQYSNRQANVFELLRELKAAGERFDLVILDPPKFADTKHQQDKAARAYKDIALQAAPLVTAGGYLMSYSCSGAIDLPLFQKITADAFLDAGRSGQIVRYLSQSEDHPVGLTFPESLYLKGLICRVD